jgi:hypothetical protein
VTTSRRLEANRANARKSTGPRTPGGKSRSSRSALRHGLSIPVVSSPHLAEQVDQLAQEIAAESTSNFVLDHARRVAEAQMDLRRITKARHEILGGMNDDGALGANLRKLKLLDRYERRARSRRKRSIRDLACATIMESLTR